MYVVKINGDKVREFKKLEEARKWVKYYCHHKDVKIVGFDEYKGLPRASSKVRPNLDMPDLRYKPFVSLS